MSKLERFKASQLDFEASLKKKGGATATSGRNTATTGTDTDCRNRDCENNDPIDENMA